MDGVTQSIVLEMTGGSTKTVKAKQCDTNSRFINVTLMDGANPFAIPADGEVYLYVLKPDKTVVFSRCDITDQNKLIAPLTEQTLAAPGTAQCELYITAADGDIKSQTFTLIIEKMIYDEDAIESANEFNGLLEKLNEIQTAISAAEQASSKAEETIADLLQRVENGDFDGEQGPKGDKGDTPVKGTDYFTAEDINSLPYIANPVIEDIDVNSKNISNASQMGAKQYLITGDSNLSSGNPLEPLSPLQTGSLKNLFELLPVTSFKLLVGSGADIPVEEMEDITSNHITSLINILRGSFASGSLWLNASNVKIVFEITGIPITLHPRISELYFYCPGSFALTVEAYEPFSSTWEIIYEYSPTNRYTILAENVHKPVYLNSTASSKSQYSGLRYVFIRTGSNAEQIGFYSLHEKGIQPSTSYFLQYDGNGILMPRGLNMGNNPISNVADPVSDLQAANKKYIDNKLAGVLRDDGSVPLQSSLDANLKTIWNLRDPVAGDQAANKKYVDNAVAAGLFGLFVDDRIEATNGYWHKLFEVKASGYSNTDVNISLDVQEVYAGLRSLGKRVTGKMYISARQGSNGVISTPDDVKLVWDSNVQDATNCLESYAINVIADQTGNIIEFYVFNDNRNRGVRATITAMSSRVSTHTLTFTGYENWSPITELTEIPSTGTIIYSELSYPLKQINDIADNMLKKDGSVKLTGPIDAQGQTVWGLRTPTGNSDAANKKYVDDAIAAILAEIEKIKTVNNLT